MPRARNIKPGFFRNDKLAALTPLTRLLFAGLWTLADREGRLEDNQVRIKGELLAYERNAGPKQIDSMLNQLQANAFITRYKNNGHRYIAINNWLKHQHPHVKEPPSTIPAPDLHQSDTLPAPDLHQSKTPDSFDSLYIPDSRTAAVQSTNSSSAKMAEVSRQNQKLATDFPWPKTAEAVRSFFQVTDDQFIWDLALAGARVLPNVSDEQLAEGVYATYGTYQQSAGLFLKTVPRYLAAIANGVAIRGAAAGTGHGAVDYPEYKRPSWRDDPERKPH